MIPHAIIEDLCAERLRQAQNRPHEERDEIDVFVLLAALGEELGEAMQAALEIRDRGLAGAEEAELVQLGALTCKTLAKFDDDTLVLECLRDSVPPAPPAPEEEANDGECEQKGEVGERDGAVHSSTSCATPAGDGTPQNYANPS